MTVCTVDLPEREYRLLYGSIAAQMTPPLSDAEKEKDLAALKEGHNFVVELPDADGYFREPPSRALKFRWGLSFDFDVQPNA